MPAIDSDVTFVARVINAPPMDRALPSSGCILLPATVGNLLPISGGSLGGLNDRPRLLPKLRNGYPLVWRNGNMTGVKHHMPSALRIKASFGWI
jgi:hypothetical protein